MMIRKLLINIAIIASFALSGCSSTAERIADAMPDIGLRHWDLPGVYRIPIQQGNLITQEMVNELKPGMTKQQVRYLLGTPILIDTFQEDHWEYLYTNRPASKSANVPIDKKRLELLFNNGRLQNIKGDMYPEGEELAKITKAENRERTIIIPVNEPRDKDNIGIIGHLLDTVTGYDEPVIKNKTPEKPAEKEK